MIAQIDRSARLRGNIIEVFGIVPRVKQIIAKKWIIFPHTHLTER